MDMLPKEYNMELLHSLYKIHTPDTKGEDQMREFIRSKLKGLNLDITKDKYGNLLIRPIAKSYNKHIVLSAHLDQVETNGKVEFLDYLDDVILGYNAFEEQTSLGADDKNGLYIILEAYRLLPESHYPTAVLFSQEEEGCIGSKQFNLSVLKHCQYGIVLDRRGYEEVLIKGAGNLFGYELPVFLSKLWGWNTGNGSVSDTVSLSYELDSVNLSVGYYNAHQKTEYTNITELCDVTDKIITALSSLQLPEFSQYKKDCWTEFKVALDGKRPKYVKPKPEFGFMYGRNNRYYTEMYNDVLDTLNRDFQGGYTTTNQQNPPPNPPSGGSAGKSPEN